MRRQLFRMVSASTGQLQKAGLGLTVVLSLACGDPATLQVSYASTRVPASGLTVEWTRMGRTTTIRGSSFTTKELGTLHSEPVELGPPGPLRIAIRLVDPGSTQSAAQGAVDLDVVEGTAHTMLIEYGVQRALCPDGCGIGPILFPSLLAGSPDTMFVYLSSMSGSGRAPTAP